MKRTSSTERDTIQDAVGSRRAAILGASGRALVRSRWMRRTKRAVVVATALTIAALALLPLLRNRTPDAGGPGRRMLVDATPAADWTPARIAVATNATVKVQLLPIVAAGGNRIAFMHSDDRLAQVQPRIPIDPIEDRAAETQFVDAGTCMRIVRIDGRKRLIGCG